MILNFDSDVFFKKMRNYVEIHESQKIELYLQG